MLGVSISGEIWSLDVIHSSSDGIEFKEIAAGLNKDMISLPRVSIFVETTDGDLLMVQQYLYPEPEPEYKIFKIIGSDGGRFDVVPVEKLDGHCLFLERRYHQCVSVLASDFHGCREKFCILFAWVLKSRRTRTLQFEVYRQRIQFGGSKLGEKYAKNFHISY